MGTGQWSLHRQQPCKMGGNLKELLPSPAKIKKVTHRPAVAVADVQAWFASLRKRRELTARALELLTLCCCRSIEVRLSVWEEFDFDRRIWTVPAQRMKTRVEHRIPLTNYAVSLLKAMPHHANSPYVFAAPQGRALHDDDLSGLMREMHAAELDKGNKGWLDPRSALPAVPHGLRSTFRDWAAENNYPREISEMALAHKVGSDVERAINARICSTADASNSFLGMSFCLPNPVQLLWSLGGAHDGKQ